MPKIKLASWINDNGSHIPQVNVSFAIGKKVYYRITTAKKDLKPADSSPASKPEPETTDTVFTFGGRKPNSSPKPRAAPEPVDYIHGDHTLVIENLLDGSTETITINIPNTSPSKPNKTDTDSRLDDLEELFANLVMPMGFYRGGAFMMDYGAHAPSAALFRRMENFSSRTHPRETDSDILYYAVISHPEISARMDAVEQQLLALIETDTVFQFAFIQDTRGEREAAEAFLELVPDLIYKPELIAALIARSGDYLFDIIKKFGAPTDSLKESLFDHIRNMYYPEEAAKIVAKAFPDGIPQKYQTDIIGKFSKSDAVKIIPSLTEESQLLILGDKHSNIKHISNPTKAVLAKTKRLKNEYLLSQLEADA